MPPFLDELIRLIPTKTPAAWARDEAFWQRWAEEYNRDGSFIQLNYGYYHPALRAVFDAEVATAGELNRRGSHFKLHDSAALLEGARVDLADLVGASPGEIAITRNASEALNIVIGGFPLEPGDEVVTSDQDYVAANEAWAQRAKTGGIRVRRAAIPLDPIDDDEIVRLFEAQLSTRTRLIQITHVLHLTGHVLPVEKLCALGRRRGIAVLLDAAHSFAQFEFSAAALGCDFLTVSLHKWLGAPLGTGLLYVRAERIPSVCPLFGDTLHDSADIRRLERFGNRPDSLLAGIREAVRWHRGLTTAVKRARLAYLQRAWSEPLRALPGFRVLTPAAPERYGAIGLFRAMDVSGEALADRLYREHRLFAAPQTLHGISAVRVTPGLPTSLEHIERLTTALTACAKS